MGNGRWREDEPQRWDQDRDRYRREGSGGQGFARAYGRGAQGYGRDEGGRGDWNRGDDTRGYRGSGASYGRGAGYYSERDWDRGEGYGGGQRYGESFGRGPDYEGDETFSRSGRYGSRQGYGRGGYGEERYGRGGYGSQRYGRGESYGSAERYGRGQSYGERYGRGGYGSGYERDRGYSSDRYGRAEDYGSRGYGSGSYRGGAYSGYGGYGSSNYSEPSRDRDWRPSSGGSEYRSEWNYDRDRDRDTQYQGYGARDYGASSASSAGLAEWPAPLGGWYSGSRDEWRQVPDDRGRGERGWGGGDSERGWWDRTKDEVRSWMGDPEAERRRRMDSERAAQRQGYMGRGPKGYSRSDQRITEDVSDRLTEDWGVDAVDIEVSVTSGEVTLSGTVPTREQKRRAENIAAEVLGVKDVQNNLRVLQQQQGSGVGTNLAGSSSAALEQTTGLSSAPTSSATSSTGSTTSTGSTGSTSAQSGNAHPKH
ncbi:MAG TPA: BON domain-containing protein [Steroidobacteraceae bacterium]|jgi:osmotically-inducible protein OsmY|nr:BON domain-containing protein [Steroidobacteraceae bacterium]